MNKYINFLLGRDYFTKKKHYDKGKVKKSERTFEVSQFGKNTLFSKFYSEFLYGV